MTLPTIPIIKSVTDLRYETADIIKILSRNQAVLVTKDSNTVAVMLSPQFYQQFITLLEEVEDEKASQKLQKAIRKGGEFVNFEEFDRKHKKKFNRKNVQSSS